MTAQPLARVIPSSGVRAGRQRARAAGGRPLPLACPVPAPPHPGDVVYGLGRIDSSGRIADRAVTTALGWSGGDRLTLTRRPHLWLGANNRGPMTSSGLYQVIARRSCQ